LNESQPSWFAVYTKPRQEQTALEHLERQAFRCFLPMAVNPYQRRTAKRRCAQRAACARWFAQAWN
jgi:hypothetical protein